MRNILICVSIAGLLFVGCDDEESYCEFVASCGMTTVEDCEAGQSDNALTAAELMGCGTEFSAQLACVTSLNTCDSLLAAMSTTDPDAPCAAETAAYMTCGLDGMGDALGDSVGDMMGDAMDGMDGMDDGSDDDM